MDGLGFFSYAFRDCYILSVSKANSFARTHGRKSDDKDEINKVGYLYQILKAGNRQRAIAQEWMDLKKQTDAARDILYSRRRSSSLTIIEAVPRLVL